MIEPWSVGVYAVERAGITVGQKCVIIGAGAIGILVFLAAKLAGAVKICIVGKYSIINSGSWGRLAMEANPEQNLSSLISIQFSSSTVQQFYNSAIWQFSSSIVQQYFKLYITYDCQL